MPDLTFYPLTTPDPAVKRSTARIVPHRRQCERRGKLSWTMVRDLRRMARTEWFGLTLGQMVVLAAARYPVTRQAMQDLLQNRTWFDPDYDVHTPLPGYTLDAAATVRRNLLMMVVPTAFPYDAKRQRGVRR